MIIRKLSTIEQLHKLQPLMKLANDAAKSENTERLLAACLLYSGLMDFLTIQAARLVEQIILKGQLAQGMNPAFKPHPDDYFYEHQPPISTRFILKEIKKLLSTFQATVGSEGDLKKIRELGNKMVSIGFGFMNARNLVVHHIGNPYKTAQDIIADCKKANDSFAEFRDAHKEFLLSAKDYRFSREEIEYFAAKGVTDF